ncbi:hypothetical protein OBBRIDRAFT_886653 [Obba rivulosa]|uniref:Uncharacterized protein n=1 Tax=Obba rivulosa TaxID=1052685 RepID=A0A8E2AZ84_9APHY|nr:hypothetical protein OBBRIDRAFT_886653 [Obba rivulosa]
MTSLSVKHDEVKAALAKLRDTPSNNPPEEILGLICDYLTGPQPRVRPTLSPESKPLDHWFCSRADETVREAATFLIRLHAYNSNRVSTWKQQFRRILTGCCECVRELQLVKSTSRHTYFGCFNDTVIRDFYKSFDGWEIDVVLEELSKRQMNGDEAQVPKGDLGKAPPAVFYHILANLRILQDSRILRIVNRHIPHAPIKDWPMDVPPPGLLLLLVAEKPEVRAWAQSQISLYSTAPISQDRFSSMHASVLKAVSERVTPNSVSNTSDDSPILFPMAEDTVTLWMGYSSILRYTPVTIFNSAKPLHLDICAIITGHLHDTGNHFIYVLKCFLLVLSRIGPELWAGEGPEYPHIVFSAIKDNPRYLEALQALPDSRKDNWLLMWTETFLKTVADKPAFNDILSGIIQFLCEGLQHERFQGLRPAVMMVASKILYVLSSPPDTGQDVNPTREAAISEVVNIHASTLVSVAFSKAYADEKWVDARVSTRRLIKQVLLGDVKDVMTTISRICTSHTAISGPKIHEQMWRRFYDSIQPGDTDGIAMIVGSLAQVSHIDDLKEVAFSGILSKSEDVGGMRSALKATNRALAVFRSGFADAASRYLDLSLPSDVVNLLGRPDVVKYLILLMFSPVESIQETGQALVGAAFDVEVRVDCFRTILEKYPDSVMSGLFKFLETYTEYARIVPEACSLSQALARCLTDVIDVLCSTPDGLLLNRDFLKSGTGSPLPSLLPKWWSLMTKALSVIFRWTPRWAIHFDNEEMVTWMRDALIFGRDMLAKWRVVEAGILAHAQQLSTGRKLSRAGRKMIDDLQQVLLELARWLRLTDEELLHQSFALLESLLGCFQDTGVRPSEEALQKLQKHIDDARKKDPKKPQTKLDTARLARLQDAISSFDEEDEVQIISHKLPEKQEVAPAVKPSTTKKDPRLGMPVKASAIALKSKIVPVAKPLTKKSAISSYFTADDQKKLELDAESSMPKFTRSARPAQPPATILVGDKRVPAAASETASTKTQSDAAPSSSDDDSEDEGLSGLAALSKLQRTPKVKKPAERRQVKMLEVPTSAPNPALERMRKREEARRMQLRMKPDISDLHRTILSWDYSHEGPHPPGPRLPLSPVPNTFIDAAHFRRVFEPLLLLECWSQLSESKEEPRDSYECRIASRQYIDNWLDMEISISQSVKKDWFLTDTDILLLRHPGTKKHSLGKAQSFRATPMGIQATVRCLQQSTDPGLQVGTVWQLSKVLSLTTLHREYAALMALPHYDFFESIIRAQVSKPTGLDPKEVRRTMETYTVNEPQARAILNAFSVQGFTLVQGPPGTGKTSTICGLVHAFLSRRPRPATTITAGRTAGPADKEPTKKVLLCAPSNAAIDEIVSRLKEGISGAGRRSTCPQVVRVGNLNSMNVSVRDVSLESLIEQKLNAYPELNKSSKESGGEIARLRAELESVKSLRQEKLTEISNVHDNSARTLALEEEIKKLNKQRVILSHQIDKAKDKQKSDSRTLDATRRRFRSEVLREADIICSTLSGSAYDYLEELDFDLIIIDEAAQSIELSSLIPLKYRCSRCVMVGDPQQLPPTVKSQEACKFGYDRSLFVRLHRQNSSAAHLLSIQYRMHPDISRLPSQLFYDKRLQDGPDMAVKTRRPWHSHPKFGTYKFFNVSAGREEAGPSGGHSLINRVEAQVAVALFNRLRQEFKAFDFDFKVGIISMYRGQIVELRRLFEQRFGAEISGTVDFNTVDGFQGQEKDVIILSCVRAGPGVQSVGFLRDVRRMNVALTRAKSSLFVLGHASTLERSDEVWRSIVLDARTRSCLSDVDTVYFTASTTTTKPASSVTKKKPEVQPQPAIPLGLTTPQAYKNSVSSKPLKETISSAGATPPAPKEATIPQKRSAPDEDTGASSSLPQSEAPATKPKTKPPLKRPKQGPTLFIPKNKQRNS